MKKGLLFVFFIGFILRCYGQSCTLSVTITSSDPAICSGNSITLTANASAGTGPYTYVWSTGETTQTISVNKAATYSVTVNDNTPGCSGVTQTFTTTTAVTPASPVAADGTTCPGGTATLTATAPGGFYQWYDAATGGNMVGTGPNFTTPPLSANTTYYVETTVNQCTSPRKSVNVTIVSSLAVTGDIVCAGQSGTISASGASSYAWYDSETGGNLLATGPIYTTPPLYQSTPYWVVASGNGCTTGRTQVTVAVEPYTQPPVAANVTICSGSTANLSATSSTPNTVFNWYTVPAGGNSLITSPNYTTPPLTTTTVYYVEGSAYGCGNPRTAVTVTVDSSPDAPVAANVSICTGNSATLTVSSTGNTYQWFSSTFSTTPLATGNTYQTPVLTANTTYYVAAVNGACTSTRTPVTVSVNPIPTPPSASGQVVCSGNVATLTATGQAGTFEWYDAATGGNLLSSSATFVTPPLTSNITYYVQLVSNGCTSSRTAVPLTVAVPAAAPTAQNVSVCSGNSATLVASGPGSNYAWYDAPTGGNLLSSSQVFSTAPLTATTTFYVESTSNGCGGARAAVTATVNPYPTAPTVSPGVSICQGTTTTLTASAASGTIEWYSAATNGSLVATGNSFTTPALRVTTTYYAQNTTNGCPSSRTPVTVSIIQNSGFEYTSDTFCTSGKNPVPTLTAPYGGTFSSQPAGLVFVDQTTGEIDLASSAPNLYKVTFQSNGPCANSETEQISIVVLPDPTFSYANSPYCQSGANAVPSYPNQPNPGVFSATPAGLVFADKFSGEINVAGTAPGTYSVTNTIAATTGCPPVSFTNTVKINAAPTVSAGPNQTVAAGTNVQLAGTYTGAPGVTWSGGAGTFSNATLPNAVYTPAAGETTVELTLTTGMAPDSCTAISSMFVTINYSPPGPPTASGTTICSGSVATLAATAPGGTYQWFDAATNGNLLATNQVYTTNPLTATTTFYVQTTIDSLTTSRTAVTVTVEPPPAAPAAPSATICAGNTTTLTASGSTGTYQWYDAATGGNLLSTNSTFTTPDLAANTAYFVQATVNDCVSPRTEVDVTVNPLPVITSNSALIICNGATLNYNITSNVPATYTWGRAAVAGVSNGAISGQTSSTISETLINTTNAPVDVTYVIQPLANSCSGVPFNFVVTVNPTIVVTSPATATICNQSASNYAIQFNYPPTSFTWSRAAVAGIDNSPVLNQADSLVQEVLTNSTGVPVNVTYAFAINSGGCAADTFKYVVTVNPTTLLLSPSYNAFCSNTAQSYTIKTSIDTSKYSWSRPAVPNISNAAVTGQASGVINETLINTSSNNVQVYYYIVPLANPCTTLKYQVTVYPSSPTPVANSNSPVCINSTINLFTDVIANGTYTWTGPNGFTSSVQNPTIPNATKINAGTYLLMVNSNGCTSAIDSVQVSVDDPPTADAGPNQLVCVTDTAVSLNGQISGGTNTGVWSTAGSGTFLPAFNQLNAVYVPSAQDASQGSVTLTLTSTSKDNCNFASSTMSIAFRPVPTAYGGGDQEVCVQASNIQLNGQATFADSVLWTTSGTGVFSPGANKASTYYLPSAQDAQSGSVVLTLQAFNSVCASVADKVNVKFTPPPAVVINSGNTLYVLRGKPTVLNPAVTSGTLKYKWSPDVNISSDTVKSPTVVGLNDITYTLQVTDQRGCVSDGKILIKVLDAFDIPNTFTPNGDGINDHWDIPALSKYPDVTVDIFNRYGQQVYHSNGYGTPWDGTYNGKALPAGVYYYIVNTKFMNQNLSGYVTIIR